MQFSTECDKSLPFLEQIVMGDENCILYHNTFPVFIPKNCTFQYRYFSSFFRKLLLISHCPEISHMAKLNCKKGWEMQSFLIIHHLHLHPDPFPEVPALTSGALFAPQKNYLPNK